MAWEYCQPKVERVFETTMRPSRKGSLKGSFKVSLKGSFKVSLKGYLQGSLTGSFKGSLTGYQKGSVRLLQAFWEASFGSFCEGLQPP